MGGLGYVKRAKWGIAILASSLLLHPFSAGDVQATISISQEDDTTPTDGWDGPGPGRAVIHWYLGWDDACTSGDAGVTTDSGLTRTQVEAAIQAAIDSWEAVVDVHFVKVGDSSLPGGGCIGNSAGDTWDCDGDPNTFQVNFLWGAGDHCDGFDFDGGWNPTTGAGSQFGHSWGPPDIWDWIPATAFIGNVHLDDGETWVVSAATDVGGPDSGLTSVTIDIQSEALHELGHSLGLAHPPFGTDSIMEALSWDMEDRVLSAYDISEIRTLYAPASTDPGVVLLFDLSGSMGWSPDGDTSAPEAEQRLSLAKRAAIPFLELLHLHGANVSRFGITSFRSQSGNCEGRTHTPLTPITTTTLDDAVGTSGTIEGLSAGGSTPLLAGLDNAIGLFTDQVGRSIVVLSDGYHNCPAQAEIGDPEVTQVIADLNNADIKTYTIGFGRPADIDHPLLSGLASATSGEFYDVTTAGFDAATWDPATALQSAYKAVLVDALGLSVGTDPLGIIGRNEVVVNEIGISPYDKRVSFILTWKRPSSSRLQCEVQASDDQLLVSGDPGVDIRSGAGYYIVSVDRNFLAGSGKVTSQPWKMTIRAGNFKEGETEPYHYSVIMDSDLEFKAVVEAETMEAGATLTARAQVRVGQRPLKGITGLTFEVLKPGQSIGNWYAENPVSQGDLDNVPSQIGGESISNRTRKAIFLTDHRMVSYPTVVPSSQIPLFDDGTHGDRRVNDGMFTNRFQDTANTGDYEFRFRVSAVLADGSVFQREKTVKLSIPVVFSPSYSIVDVKRLGMSGLLVTVTVRDRLGNHLPPGHGATVALSVPNADPIGDIVDHLDGSYSREFTVTGSIDDIRNIAVTVGGATHTVAWSNTTPPHLNWLLWILLILLLILIVVLVVIVRRS